MNPWVVYCDGSAEPNPGRIGLGAVFAEPDDTRHTLSQAANENGCNNEAELRALLATLLELKLHGAGLSNRSAAAQQSRLPGWLLCLMRREHFSIRSIKQTWCGYRVIATAKLMHSLVLH
jgi:ribonuclease HI